MHLTGIFISEQGRGLAVSAGQIAIRLLTCLIYIILEGTGHGTKGIYLLILLLISEDKHAFFIMIPVSGNLIEIALCHERSLGTHIAPLIVLQILNPSLHGLDNLCSLGHQQRKSLSDNIHSSEELHLTPQLVVVTILNVFPVCQILFQLFLLVKGSSVDTLQLCLAGIAVPISHGRRGQFECLDALGAHQMRSCTQIGKFSLTVEGNLRILRQIPDQLHLVRLVLFFHELDCLCSGKSELLKLCTFLDDLFHLCFQIVQILSGKRCMLKIIVKSCINTGTDGQLCIGEQVLHSLCQHVRCGVADGCQPFLVICSTNLQFTVSVQYGSQILNLTVNLCTAGCSCKSFTDIKGNVIDAFALSVFLHGAVLQCNLHTFTSYNGACFRSSLQKESPLQYFYCKGRIIHAVPPFLQNHLMKDRFCLLHLLVTGASVPD